MTSTISLSVLSTPEGRTDPYAHYAAMHAAGTVHRVEPGHNIEFAVTGYDEASAVLRDPNLRVVDAEPPTAEQWRAEPTRSILFNSVMFTNEPRHIRMRRTFNQVFTVRRVAAMEPSIDAIATRLLDAIAAKAEDGNIDFMAEFAYPLPSDVMGELLGVPESDRKWYQQRALAIGAILELGGSTPENVRLADESSTQLQQYFTELANDRRAQPREDVVTALTQAADGPDAPLTTEELLANLIVLFNAGFVTTTHLLGNGLFLLLQRPELAARLRAEPDGWAGFVEEVLRFEPPVHFVMRYAATDTTISGHPVAAGERIMILLGAANRDPRRFVDPDRFDPDRAGPPPLSFGIGTHHCVGAALARLEGRRGFIRFMDKFEHISLAATPPTPRQMILRGYDELWLTLAAAN